MIDIDITFSSDSKKLNRDFKLRSNFEDHDETYNNESKLWILFYQLGFSSLNLKSACNVKFGRSLKEGDFETKNVDIIAESNETRVYAESTTQKSHNNKIKSWISDVDKIRKWEHSNPETNEKNVVFVYHSQDPISTEADLKRLKNKRIIYFDDSIIDYFLTLKLQSVRLAYFQLLAYLCGGQQIRGFRDEDYKFPAIRTRYGSGNRYCYLFAINPAKLIPISTVPHRKNSGYKNENYQRIVKKAKISSIKKYIKTERGVFPTNIVIHIDNPQDNLFTQLSKSLKLNDIDIGILSLPRKYNSVSIIDGQHRLFAYDELDQAEKDFIYVIAFTDMNAVEQVNVFVDINRNQSKVSSSLLWDLYPTIRDPNDIESQISILVKALNNNAESPLYGIISFDSSKIILEKKLLKLTLESVCTAIKKANIIPYIDVSICNEQNIKNKDNLFTYSLISNWFKTIKSGVPEHWSRMDKTLNFFISNQGFGALIKLFKLVIKESKFFRQINGKTDEEIQKEFLRYLKPVFDEINKIETKDEMKERKGASESAKVAIYKDFIRYIQSSDKGLHDFGSAELQSETNDKIIEILDELKFQDEGKKLEIKESFFIDSDRLNKGDGKYINTLDAFKKGEDNQIAGILKTIVSFSNCLGGQLVIGINDPQHDVTGINNDLSLYKNNLDTYKRTIQQIIDENIINNLSIGFEICEHIGKKLLIIKVKRILDKNLNNKGLVKLKIGQNKTPYFRDAGPKNSKVTLENIDDVIASIIQERKEDDSQ